MRQRVAEESSSLELLLDTICNTFGGVVFIALLVILLLRSSAPRRAASTEPAAVSALEISRLRTRLAELESQLEVARSQRDASSRLVSQLMPEQVQVLAEKLARLRERREQLEAEAAAEEAKIAELKTRLTSADASVVELEQRRAELQKQLESARANLQQAEQQVERERRKRTRQLRMPVVHDSGWKRSVGIIVRYGRMYVWHRYDEFGNRMGLNTDEFVVVGKIGEALVTRAIPTRGIPLDNSPDLFARVRERLRRFRPSEFSLTIVVRNDSFEQFARLRDIVVALGYEYWLMPTRVDGGVVDRGGERAWLQ